MPKINYDINKYYKNNWLVLDTEIREKLKAQKLKNSDFCTQVQEIIDPIIESFNAILEKWENPVISKININRLVNNILLMILSDLEIDECKKEENWLFPEKNEAWSTPTLIFSKK